jgi:hypothetical protein
VRPAEGTTKADKLARLQVGKLHSSLSDTPFQANRVLAVVGSMYAFAGGAGLVPEGTNPAKGVDKFKESRRERFLTSEEMERLGNAIREAETTGIPWKMDKSKPNAKHVPKAKRSTKIAPPAAAAFDSSCSPAAVARNPAFAMGVRRLRTPAVCSCPTARVDGRQSSSMLLPSRC